MKKFLFLLIFLTLMLIVFPVFAGQAKSEKGISSFHEIYIENCVIPVIKGGKAYVKIPNQDKNTPKANRVKIRPRNLNPKSIEGTYPISKNVTIKEKDGLMLDLKTVEGVGRVDRANITITDGAISKIVIVEIFQ